MFGCFTALAICASRRKRVVDAGSSTRNSLSATSRSRTVSRARYTTAEPPCPITSPTSYGPTSVIGEDYERVQVSAFGSHPAIERAALEVHHRLGDATGMSKGRVR